MDSIDFLQFVVAKKNPINFLEDKLFALFSPLSHMVQDVHFERFGYFGSGYNTSDYSTDLPYK